MRLETTMVPAPVGASCRPHSSSGWRVAASGALILSSVVVGVSVEADEGGRLQPGQTECVDTRANEGDIVAANSTIIAPAGSGYATVHRRGVNWQASSNNNFPANQTIPNLTLTEAGVDGEICVTSSATTHVVLDVAGSFPKSVFNPESPNGAGRILDARAGKATVPQV